MSDEITPGRLRFERSLPAPVERVWAYVTDPELRARWFMGGPIDGRVGGRIGFRMDHDALSDAPVPTPERYRAAIGAEWSEEITRFDPPHAIAFTWDGGAGGEVTITLQAEAAGRTRLVLTHTGLRGREDAANFAGGWGSHLAVLDARVGGGGVPDFWRLHADAEAHARAALDQPAA